ncbi:MAG TPA: ABC transporter substrate-binding protein [Nitrospira sp.]|nr:ABC transporter substrate-binding protein [Nitrospira sp.]
MRSYVASWIMVGEIMTALTGCGWKETANTSTTVSNYNRLQRHPEMAAIVNAGASQIEYSPTDAVKSTVDDFFSILGDEALKQPGRSGERRLLIEQVIRNSVNCEEAARRALGLSWEQLTDTKRQEFVNLFIQSLRDMFANRIDQYHDARMLVLSERRSGRFAEVKTSLVGSKVDTSLDFRVGRQSGHWLIYDLVIDGASLVSNYQAQFNKIIRDDSYAGLIERMKRRNLLAKVFERTAPDIPLSSMHTAPQ